MNKYNKYSKDAVDVRKFIDKINNTARMLKEAYVYEDEYEDDMNDMPQGEGQMRGEEEELPQEEGMESQNDGKQYVDAIRKSALQGIQIFANDVDNPSYEFFKKVFIMADKVLSEKENGEGE